MAIGRLLLIYFVVCVSIVDGSHFAGGSITWRPENATPSGLSVPVRVRERLSWLQSSVSCSAASIAAQTPMLPGSGSLTCLSGNCSSWIVINTATHCTDFSVSVDVATGEYYETKTLALDIAFSISFATCCWFGPILGGSTGNWAFAARVNTAVRPDGYINSSPLGNTVSDIYKEVGVQHVYQVHIVDVDETDILKCRWAVNSTASPYGVDECADLCGKVPSAVLIEENCTISFTLTTANMHVGVALQIEDFYNSTATVPMSSVPLQFLFYGYTAPSGCSKPPTIIGNRPNRACIPVMPGDNITELVVVQVFCPNKTIIDFASNVPVGVLKSSIQNPSVGIYEMYLSWIPVASQDGPQSVCMAAIDNTKVQSEQWCITFLVGSNLSDITPVMIQGSVSPTGIVLQNHTIFSIQTSIFAIRPRRNGTYISFWDATLNGSLVQQYDCSQAQEVTYTGFSIVIQFPVAPWIVGHFYYITFDSGVAVGRRLCGQESAPNNDSTFWTFNIFNPTTTSTTSTSTTTTTTVTTTTTTVTTTTTTVTTTTTTVTTSTTATTTTTVTLLTTTPPPCSPPKVTLIPGSSTLSSPVQFRRSQDFYIVSVIELNCSSSLSTSIQWTVKNCTSVCSYPMSLDPTVVTTSSELYIPARTLPYGLYELQLTVTMVNTPSASTSSRVYVQITPSGITANLVQYGTSMITSGSQQDLQLDPGTYSVDLDGNVLNISNWKYDYYCRIYGSFTFPNLQGSLLSIDDLRNDSLNPSCLSNRTGWQFGNSAKSSFTILSGSLQSNRTYQIMVQMVNRQSSSRQSTGYLLVKVEDTRPQMILIGCVIWTLCEPNLEFQRVNPTTQVALFSVSAGSNGSIQNITWNIYSGVMNSSANFTQWIPFKQTSAFQNSWFFGGNTSNFTATNQLFLANPQIHLWRFEVAYAFISEISSSSLNFVINQPPQNGSCSIGPLNGTTTSVFNLSCSNWFDEDGIKDYALYAWTTDPTKRTIVAYSALSTFQMQLPIGDNQTSLLRLVVHIRDQSDCLTEVNISSVTVMGDSVAVANLISDVQSSSGARTTNTIVQLLASGNQNIVGQVITSVSQQFNQLNSETVDRAASKGVPVASISISSLSSQRVSQSSAPLNQSALDEYQKEVNARATVRDYLITFATQLPITTSNSIKLQASSLAQLTKATSELTRATVMSASDQCYRLTQALYSMRTRIPFEDAQAAANDLLQCAANVLSAVNGPLQQRTAVLELDFSRATTFPADYDTDLESDWANPNLFADGTDFSWQAIQNNRNSYYQKQLASHIISQMNELISLLTSSLNIHLNVGQDFTIDTSQVLMSLETKSVESFAQRFTREMGNGQVQLPDNFHTFLGSNGKVSIRSMMEPLATFGTAKSQSNTNLSRTIAFSILDMNQNEVSVQTDTNHSIEIVIPRDPNLAVPSLVRYSVTSMNSTPHQLTFRMHYVNLNASLPTSVHWEIQPVNTSVAYLFVYRFDQIPQLNSSMNTVDGWTLLCPANLTNDSLYRYFIDNRRTVGHQSVVVGLRELNATEMSQGCSSSSSPALPITNERFHFSSDYRLRTYTSGCYYLDQSNQWQAGGLIVGPMTNLDQTHCFSTHLTTFAGGFVVLPDAVDWSYVFANADFMKNKTIYLTVICVSAVYLILLIYARWYDKKDVEKLGVTVLPDNHPSDQYHYETIAFTGQRRDAGTNSHVHFVIHGDDDDTQIRTFADPHRKVLQRGGVDAFLLSVPKSLGLLNCVRIWHDNSGNGASSSWFLKYLIVRDLQTMQKFHFICQRWFAVEKDDGKIERVLPVANDMQKNQFSYLLTKRTYHSVSDGHLWFSIFSRPPSNQFTRVQRCTCCFVLFFVSMFLSIMYYDLSKEAKSNKSTKTVSSSLGALYITPQQMIIGVIVELFALVPSLLLVQLFRRLRPRRKLQSPVRQALYQVKPHLQSYVPKKRSGRSSLTFPWWCIFIAYGLCLIFVGLSILFIIARGIEFGDEKTQKWLVSIISGLVSSILLTQPLKILALAVFFACFCGKSNDDKEASEFLDESEIDLEHDEEYLHSTEKKSLFTYRSPIRAEHLNEAQVDYARDRRVKEVQMWTILREMFVYLCFLSLLYVVIYSNQNSNAFFQVDHLRKYLINSRQDDNDYTKISTTQQYWNWLENSFVGNVRAQQWYNGEVPRNLSGYIDDKSNRLIGWATMRQLRIKPSPCPKPNMISSTCRADYSFSGEDKQSYAPGWVNGTQQTYNAFIRQAFQYQRASELDTYVYVGDHGSYSGGGYVYGFRGRLSDLRSNLSQLHQLGWIDDQTRAVIIQMTLYNPNIQLFTAVTFLAEFLSSTGVYPTVRFEPISFYVFTSLYHLLCTIAYMLLIVYFMWIEVRMLIELRWKYLRRFWSWMEVGIIVCSWASVGIYAWRYYECHRISELFAETNGYVYVNLQRASYINNVLTYLLGFCSFFGTIKMIRLCRYNQRLYLFIHTLQSAGKELLAFAMMFSIVFVSFMCLFYFLFMSTLAECSSLLGTARMLFEMTLMKFDAHQLTEAAAFLGPFCFSLFIILVVFVCMSMFLSIISDNFRQAGQKVDKKKEEMFSFMWQTFQRWTGLKEVSEEESQMERDARMRLEYHDPIDRFPEKVDRLLDALNRIYVNQVTEQSK